MKYCETDICFSEFPGETSLLINITSCPHVCIGCHSPHLREDIGEILTEEVLDSLIEPQKKYITLVGFMGGDAFIEQVDKFAYYIKRKYHLKIGWYSGNDSISDKIDWNNFDYVKVGHYKESCGDLRNPNTNQRMYRIRHYNIVDNCSKHTIEDITSQFWKK